MAYTLTLKLASNDKRELERVLLKIQKRFSSVWMSGEIEGIGEEE